MSMKKRLYRESEAVSEVVGTILILAMTIVLFSSIFATVSLMETPEQRSYVDFETSFVKVEGEYTLTVTHRGGRTLQMFNTAFNIVVYGDGTYSNARYRHDAPEVGYTSDLWGIGQVVVIDLEHLPERLGYGSGSTGWDALLNAVEVAELLVMDVGRYDLLWRSEFRLVDPIPRLILKDMGVEYRHGFAGFVKAGDSVSLYANVGPRELLGGTTVTVDLSPLLDYDGIEDMHPAGGDRYVYTDLEISSEQENGTYLLRLEASHIDGEVRSESAYIILNVGVPGVSPDEPFIMLDENKIRFRPASPTNGDQVQIHAIVENFGGSSAICDIYLYGNHTRDDEPTLIHPFRDVNLAAGGARDLIHTWVIRGSGAHDISLVVRNITWHGGDYSRPYPEAHKILHVQPTILLVDDVRGVGDDAALMYGDLQATESRFDYHVVDGTHRPTLERLEKYDIIIWMCGSQTEETLTEGDQSNLETVMDNGTSLWLIGSSLMGEIGPGAGFAHDYLSTGINYGGSIEGNISGVDIPLDFGDIYEVVEASYCDHLVPIGDGLEAARDEDGNIIAVSYENEEHGYRSMYNSFLFSSMDGMPGEGAQARTDMVFKVINWLGGVEFKGGNDVAVAEQSFSTVTPMYMDTVTIEALIRNNGMEDLTGVDIRLQVNGIVLENDAKTIDLEGGGGTQRVTFDWIAEPVGKHEVLVVADPFNKIVEINKENNDIRYKDVNYHVTVLFSVLVVNDDHSGSNTAEYVTESLDRLGYAYQVFDVPQDERGPTSTVMGDYNSVYWVCGHSTDTLMEVDMEAIKEYLDGTRGTSFILMGNHVLRDLTVDPYPPNALNFLQNYLGIDPGSVGEMTDFPGLLTGMAKDPIGHGLAYAADQGAETSNPYTFEVLGGEVFLTDTNGNAIASRFNPGPVRTIFMGVDMYHMVGPIYGDQWYADFAEDIDTSPAAVRQELVYMMTKWFGNVDNRIELRVSSVDIQVENPRPVLGRSYLVTTTVYNVGYRESNALVRFKDGNSLIASESIYVPGNGFSTSEVTWTPLYAGPERSIRVLVDPLCNVEEIGDEDGDHMGFNNHAMVRLPVYYFWDDMENGTANWRTEATIMNINAEHPLEFLTEEHEKAYTDIVANWDKGYENASKYINVTDMFSYSDPYSYWLQEPRGTNETHTEELPVDVVMAIDTSGSMHSAVVPDGWNSGADHPDSRMYQAVEAAINFIEEMNEEDRLEIWTFHPSGTATPYRYRELSFMTDVNKADYIQSLIDIREGNGIWVYDSGKPRPHWGPVGNTPYYDTVGRAVQSAVNIGNENIGLGRDRLEFVIGLADGIGNVGNEYSEKSNWGEGGLLHAPPLIFNIGFIAPQLRVGTSYTETPYWNNYHDGQPVREYDMFNVANTSPNEWQHRYGNITSVDEYYVGDDDLVGTPYTGRYYFAEKGEDVGVVFEEIRKIIREIAGQQADAGKVTSMPGGSAGLMQEVRYMRGVQNEVTVNGLTTYYLGLTQSDTPRNFYSGNRETLYTGMRVWVRDSSGNEVEVTGGTAEAVVVRDSDGADIQTITWNCPQTLMNPTDSVVVRIYQERNVNPPTSLAATFTTEQLGATQLDPVTWTIHYYTQRGFFNILAWGTTTYNSRIEGFTYSTGQVNNPPDPPVNVYPPHGSTGISTDPTLRVSVSDPDGDTMTVRFYDASNDNLIGTATNVASGSQASVTWSGLDYSTTYTWYAVADDGHLSTQSDTWSFTTHAEGEDPGPDPDPGLPTGENFNKTAVTPSLNLTGYATARLTFWHKYNIVPDTNGAFLQVGFQHEGVWKWRYVVPTFGTYTGNMNMSVERRDDFNRSMGWAWNGVSGGGAFTWDHVQVNILPYIDGVGGSRENVRVRFNYTQYGSGTGYGWFFDDVKLVVSRDTGAPITDNMKDVWRQVTTNGTDGEQTTAWWNGQGVYGEGDPWFLPGIDNSLITTPIDLTNARTAFLEAYFKFNINTAAGAPPDGFMVEVTTDGGRIWNRLNDGSRAAEGVYDWTRAEDLDRLNVDLSGFRGNVIRIRFRVFTCNASTYNNFEDEHAGFGGFYVDNVIVSGRTVQVG